MYIMYITLGVVLFTSVRCFQFQYFMVLPSYLVIMTADPLYNWRFEQAHFYDPTLPNQPCYHISTMRHYTPLLTSKES